MGDNPFQPKNNSKMAELFMECEEEELEPWQKKVKEVEDDDDDEPIFVGEITSSKPAISNILNRVNPSSYSRGIKNGALSRGITAAFKPTSQHYTNPTSNPVAASPVNFHPESRSSDSSIIVQPLSKPGYITNSSRVVSNNSSELLFDLTQDTGSSHYQGGPTLSIPGMNESSFLSKRPSTSEVNSVNPKKPKPSDGISGLNSSAVFPSVKSLSVTSPQATSSKGTNTSSNQSKNGTPFPRACPKCNIHFNLLDPLKNHMKEENFPLDQSGPIIQREKVSVFFTVILLFLLTSPWTRRFFFEWPSAPSSQCYRGQFRGSPKSEREEGNPNGSLTEQ